MCCARGLSLAYWPIEEGCHANQCPPGIVLEHPPARPPSAGLISSACISGAVVLNEFKGIVFWRGLIYIGAIGLIVGGIMSLVKGEQKVKDKVSPMVRSLRCVARCPVCSQRLLPAVVCSQPWGQQPMVRRHLVGACISVPCVSLRC